MSSARHSWSGYGRLLLEVGIVAAVLAPLAFVLTGPAPFSTTEETRQSDGYVWPAAEPRSQLAPERQAQAAETSRIHVLPVGPDGLVRVPELQETAAKLNTPDATLAQDFEVIDTLLDYFRRTNDGANPSGGENEEITAQLRGENARHLAVLPPDHPAINAQGQLLDRWGAPFYFHPMSRDLIQIRSAGPDSKLWTTDDVVHGEL